jgi:plasmid rolling circle replication initiator protein Rep
VSEHFNRSIERFKEQASPSSNALAVHRADRDVAELARLRLKEQETRAQLVDMIARRKAERRVKNGVPKSAAKPPSRLDTNEQLFTLESARDREDNRQANAYFLEQLHEEHRVNRLAESAIPLPLGRERNPELSRIEEKRWRADRNHFALLMGSRGHELSHLFEAWASRLRGCGENLFFAECPDGHQRRLRAGHFCQTRACPICMWRRSLRDKAVYSTLVQAAVAEGKHVVHLVLTMKNVSSPYGQVKRLWQAFAKLRRRRVFDRVEGGIARIEVTWSEAAGYHFHMHVLVLVPALSRADIKAGVVSLDKAFLSEAWQEITGDSFVVHIGSLKPEAKHFRKAQQLGLGRAGAVVAAIDELAKYPAKDADFFLAPVGDRRGQVREVLPFDLVTGEVNADFIVRSEAFCELLAELHGKNLKSMFGWFRGKAGELSEEVEGSVLADDEAGVFVSDTVKQAETHCTCGKLLVGVVYRHGGALHYVVSTVGDLAEMVSDRCRTRRSSPEGFSDSG